MYLKCLHASKVLLHMCFCSRFANLHLCEKLDQYGYFVTVMYFSGLFHK